MNKINNTNDDTTMVKEALICEIGERLQKARKRKQLSLDDVVEDLKFNRSFLAALESGTWSAMPGEVYALGFLRQYAKLLEVNVDVDIQRIKSNRYELTKPLTYPDSPISPNRSWVIAAILLFVLINVFINLFEASDNKEASAMPEEAPLHSPLNNVLPSHSPYSQTETSPSNTVQNPLTIIPAATDAPKVKNQAAAASKGLTSKPLTIRAYVFFASSADVWLQVYQEKSGLEPLLLREVLLKVGESLLIESQEQLLFTAGKPSALEVSIDGNIVFAQGSLGQNGKILKLYPINLQTDEGSVD